MLQITSALNLSLFWEGLVAASALIGIFFVGLFWTCSIIPLFTIYVFAPKVMLALNLTGDMAKWS